MSYSRNSLKGGYIGAYMGVIKGDAGSLNFSSYEACAPFRLTVFRRLLPSDPFLVKVRFVRMFSFENESPK